jgi:hypothetical protein
MGILPPLLGIGQLVLFSPQQPQVTISLKQLTSSSWQGCRRQRFGG